MFTPKTFSSLLALSIFSIRAHALLASDSMIQGTSPNLKYRDEYRPSWDEYNQVTELFKQQGLCRSYIDHSDCCDNLAICTAYCATISDATSITCWAPDDHIKDPSLVKTNPNGEHFKIGECWCNNPALEYVSDEAIKMFKELGPILCEVWLKAASYSAEILASLSLPAGVSWRAFQAVMGAVDKAQTASGLAGIGDLNDAISGVCGSNKVEFSNAELIKGAYQALSGADWSKFTETTA